MPNRFHALKMIPHSKGGEMDYLYAGIAGLAIMMASKWNLPSATNTMASAPPTTTGAVHPSTSPARTCLVWNQITAVFAVIQAHFRKGGGTKAGI